MVTVRAAGLWEYPVGQMAVRKGTTKAVVTAGRHLIDGHTALDAGCREIAPMLGITLPVAASPQQRGFVSTLGADSGKRFDSDMANILRVTHGPIFNTIAKIRSTTRNSLVRALANQANATVLDHITVMEETGLVDFDQVLYQETAPPKLPAADVTPPAPPGGQPEVVLTPPSNATSTPLDLGGTGTGTDGGGGGRPGADPAPGPTAG